MSSVSFPKVSALISTIPGHGVPLLDKDDRSPYQIFNKSPLDGLLCRCLGPTCLLLHDQIAVSHWGLKGMSVE